MNKTIVKHQVLCAVLKLNSLCHKVYFSSGSIVIALTMKGQRSNLLMKI